MKGQATFDADIWLESWFRKLPAPVKLLWFFLHSECDRAGWWNPDPDLVEVRLKSGVGLDEAAAALAGQVTVHASGWWELKGYISTAYPKGLSSSNPMHKHVTGLILKHRIREVGFGESAPLTSFPTGALDPQPLHKDEGLESSQAVALAGADLDPDQGLPRAYEGPTQGLKEQGAGSKAPGDGSQVSGVELKDGGGSREGGQVESPPDAGGVTASNMALTAVLMRFTAAGGHDVPPWSRVTLLGALESKDRPLVDAAARLYLAHASGPMGHSVAGFCKALARWLQAARDEAPQGCQHPKDARVWWTKATDEFKHGMKVRWWRCEVCRHAQAEPGTAYLEEHEHDFGEAVHERAWVVDEAGRSKLVDSYRACRVCPTRADAAQGVAA